MLLLGPGKELIAFGENEYGQIGNGKTGTVQLPEKVQNVENVKAAACGLNYSLAVTDSGEVYEWGYPGRHSAGLFSRLFRKGTPADKQHPFPTQLEVLEDVSDIAAGELHYLAVTSRL